MACLALGIIPREFIHIALKSASTALAMTPKDMHRALHLGLLILDFGAHCF